MIANLAAVWEQLCNPVSFHPVELNLTVVEARVLGSLMEKESTTPDYYPLSLNALINACNQKSNREPAMNLDESAVHEALEALNRRGLAGEARSAEGRVTKYEHRIGEVFNLGRRESALLCVLLLRGAQTPGELRGRAERMHRFDDLGEVQSTLQRLIAFDPPLVKSLTRQPGTKEARYAHLLSGDVDGWEPALAATSAQESADPERLERLESDLAALREDLAELRVRFSEFQKKFE